jgi:Rac GTPase-activating protein 1
MKATDDERLIQAVGELPEPNRDTLAYICLHLQRVAANSARNRMEVDNLASILCPTILGDNIANMTKYGGNLLEEQKQQQIVLSRLLKMPAVSLTKNYIHF